MDLKNNRLKFNIILYISFFFCLQTALAGGYITIYNIKILPPDVEKQYFPLWNTIKGNLIYNINQINYYKIIDDDDISDIKIRFKIFNIKSDLDFNIEYQFLEERIVYNIKSKKDFEEFPHKFISDLKQAFPLRGIIFKTNGLYLLANIGKYYNVKKGDIFIVVDQDNRKEVKGIAIVLNIYNRYSELIITTQNQMVNNNDILLPFIFNLHLQYHPFHKVSYYSNIKDQYQFSGLYGPAYKIFSSLGNYMLISDEKETGLFINMKNHYEKIEDVNYNEIREIKFDLKEKYLAYLLRDGRMKIIDLGTLKKYVLKFDKSISNYNLILEQEKGLYTIEDIRINDFSFYKEDNLIFIDGKQKKIVNMNIKNNSFKEIIITNKIFLSRTQKLKNVHKIFITPNNKKMALYDQDNNIVLIKDLETSNEELIQNVEDIKLSKSGVYFVYKYGQNIIFYELYTAKHITYKLYEPFDYYILSYSERYIIYIRNHNPNQLNYFDREDDKINKDVFENNKYKYIKEIEGLYDDKILLYGKLFDIDYNAKLDYRDLNNLSYFDLLTGSYSMVLDNIDDFYGLSNYKKYVIYSRYKKLFMTKTKYGKISE